MLKFLKFGVLVLLLSCSTVALPQAYCGEEGVWLQMLGSGELDLDNDRAAASYLVWLDGSSVFLVDAGPGSSYRFDQSDAEFNELAAIALTQTTIEHSGDLANFIAGSFRSERSEPLRIFGPEARNGYLALTQLVQELIGEGGAYPQFSSVLKTRNQLGYQVWPRDIAVISGKRWAQFSNDKLSLSAMPVRHGDIPTLAFRVDIAGQTIVFANDFSNRRGVIADFADGADALVVTHALPVGSRGRSRDQYLVPEQIARLAKEMNVRYLVLGSRSWRTFGRESRSSDAIRPIYDGGLVFANDLECWEL